MFAPVDGGCCREARTQRQAPHAGTSAHRTLLERRLCRNSGAPKPAGNFGSSGTAVAADPRVSTVVRQRRQRIV